MTKKGLWLPNFTVVNLTKVPGGLRVNNHLGTTVHFDNSVRHRNSIDPPTTWINLSVKVRFAGLSKSSDHHFRFRFVKKRDFEVEVINTATT